MSGLVGKMGDCFYTYQPDRGAGSTAFASGSVCVSGSFQDPNSRQGFDGRARPLECGSHQALLGWVPAAGPGPVWFHLLVTLGSQRHAVTGTEATRRSSPCSRAILWATSGSAMALPLSPHPSCGRLFLSCFDIFRKESSGIF